MKRTKDLNRNKGITLIALVITIIVMLILVGVTISMAVNGGLFDYAGRAVGDTRNALSDEQKLSEGKIKVGDVWYNSIDEYLDGPTQTTTATHNWTRTEDTFTCSHCNKTYTMGQVVNYNENSETNSTKSLADVNGHSEQTIEVEDATWIILGIDDTDGDNVNETLLITTQVGVSSLALKGAEAYNNGPTEINRICRELYSNSEYGFARGMTIEDVNRTFNFTPPGGILEYEVVAPGSLTTKLGDIDEFWESMEGKEKQTPDGTDLANYELNGYYYYFSGTDYSELATDYGVGNIPITITQRTTIMGEPARYPEGDIYEFTGKAWLASVGVSAYPGYVDFGPGFIGPFTIDIHGYAFETNGKENADTYPLRPVVELKSTLL